MNATDIVATNDGGYALSGNIEMSDNSSADFCLVKTNASGHDEWFQVFGGLGWDEAQSLVTASDGGYVIAGTTEYSSFGNGILFMKTTLTGNFTKYIFSTSKIPGFGIFSMLGCLMVLVVYYQRQKR